MRAANWAAGPDFGRILIEKPPKSAFRRPKAGRREPILKLPRRNPSRKTDFPARKHDGNYFPAATRTGTIVTGTAAMHSAIMTCRLRGKKQKTNEMNVHARPPTNIPKTLRDPLKEMNEATLV